jgi:hypothetical protein
MLEYGVPHVRGGAYSAVHLTEEQEKALHRELQWLSPFLLGIEMHPDEIQRKNLRSYVNHLIDIESIQDERIGLVKVEEKYKEFNGKLEAILKAYSGNADLNDFREFYHPFNSPIFKEIDWIQDHIMNCSFHFTDRDDVYFANLQVPTQRYRNCLPILKKMARTYLTIFGPIDDIPFPSVYLRHPEFVFDHYFNHYQTPRFQEYDISIWVTLCDVFREMATKLIHRVKELTEELLSYPADMEAALRNKRYILDCISNTAV